MLYQYTFWFFPIKQKSETNMKHSFVSMLKRRLNYLPKKESWFNFINITKLTRFDMSGFGVIGSQFQPQPIVLARTLQNLNQIHTHAPHVLLPPSLHNQ